MADSTELHCGFNLKLSVMWNVKVYVSTSIHWLQKGRSLLCAFGHNFRLFSCHSGDYESALKLLEITAECEETMIRRAYLDKAKVYHPDSLSDSADPKQFAKVMTDYLFPFLSTTKSRSKMHIKYA